VDITFWVIQAVLLTPVLFMAASVGLENHPTRGRRIVSSTNSRASSNNNHTVSGEPPVPQAVVATPSVVAAAVAGLSQFTAEQQARLVLLRAFVQEARSGQGALSDDLAAAPEVPARQERRGRASWRPRLGNQQLMLIGGVVLLGLGLVGVVRTSVAMDELQRTSVSGQEPLTPAARLLPGVILNPAKYLSAVNATSSANSARVDPLYAVGQMQEKQAMDRWEALVGIGLSLLLFVNAMRAAAANEDEMTSVAFDFAPFLLVAAVLFAGLSFFELP
jgi:hypothetical protein